MGLGSLWLSAPSSQDLDLDKPRWDKFYAEGRMTVHFTIGAGVFDVKRLVKYGLRDSLELGTADGSPDPDCPCLVNGTLCPCNTPRFSQYPPPPLVLSGHAASLAPY